MQRSQNPSLVAPSSWSAAMNKIPKLEDITWNGGPEELFANKFF